MSITIETLNEAIQIKEQIAALEARLEKILGTSITGPAPVAAAVAAAPDKKGKGRRKMSAAGRARIIAAQKARWAAHKAAANKK